jgi:transposase
LTPELQNEVLSGNAVGMPLRRLAQLSALEPTAQRAAFDALLADREAGRLRKLPRQSPPKPTTKPGAPPSLCLRGVAYFNPKMCDQQRSNAQKKLDKVSSFVRELNAKAVDSSLTEDDLLAKLDRKLRKYHLLKVYDVSTHTIRVDERRVPQLECHLRQNEWNHRRLLDGFSLLTMHTEVKLSPLELCNGFRAKDTVEKDFQVIKSVLKMLPVRHHTDPKVLAHVTICVLALLLERLLRDELKGSMSPELALELLAPCHLNRYGQSPESRAYLVTEPDEPQKKILRLLKLQHLVDDNRMIDEIHPK